MRVESVRTGTGIDDYEDFKILDKLSDLDGWRILSIEKQNEKGYKIMAVGDFRSRSEMMICYADRNVLEQIFESRRSRFKMQKAEFEQEEEKMLHWLKEMEPKKGKKDEMTKTEEKP